MNDEILSKLLDLCKDLNVLVEKFEVVLDTNCDFLSGEISDLWDIIGDYIELPKDGVSSHFNRDPLFNLLHDFSVGDITKEKTMKKLIKMNKDSKEGLFI